MPKRSLICINFRAGQEFYIVCDTAMGIDYFNLKGCKPGLMILKGSITLFFVTFFVKMSVAQFCPILGHTPDGAYPVCGNITKVEPDFFYCSNGQVNTTYCDIPASDAPAFWYKFTCYQSGSLGFLITHNDLNSDDYD